MICLCLLTVCLLLVPAAAQPVVGYDPRSIEIDLPSANVTVDLGAANDFPLGGSTFIDWITFDSGLDAHTVTDGIGNADGSMVGSGDTLKAGSVLAKEDIYRIYASNNTRWLYLAMARRANNGNSTWHWFFTKLAPTYAMGQPIVFHLQNGDFEVRVCFPRGSNPGEFNAGIYQVQGLTAGQVVHVSASNIWAAVPLVSRPSAMGAFSLNLASTPALPGAIESHGFPATTYDTATFAEGAANLSELGISPCNSSAFVTVLTRSSCSLTSSVKDTTQPAHYFFGNLVCSINQPTIECTDVGGAPVTLTGVVSGGTPPYTVCWSEGPTDLGCSNPLLETFAPGEHTVTLTATDDGGCTSTADVTFYIPTAVIVNLTVGKDLDCVSSVPLQATASGGDGDYTYVWTVGGQEVFTDHQATGGASSYTLVFPDSEYCGTRTVAVSVTDGSGCDSAAPSVTLEKTTTITVK